jgi:hypothetical protein
MMNRRKRKGTSGKGKWEEEEEHRGGEDQQRYAIEKKKFEYLGHCTNITHRIAQDVVVSC